MLAGSRRGVPAGQRRAAVVSNASGSRKRARRDELAVDLAAAIGFISKLKARFGESSPELSQFLQVLVEYRAGRLATEVVCETVAVLLRDEPDILEEFTFFSPRYATHTRCSAARARFEGILPPTVMLHQAGVAQEEEAGEQQQQEQQQD